MDKRTLYIIYFTSCPCPLFFERIVLTLFGVLVIVQMIPQSQNEPSEGDR